MGNKLQHGHIDADDGGVLGSAAGAVPTGTLLAYGGSSAPSGYLICDGSAVSRTTYAALFVVLGTAFGSGDGSTTFNLPDLRGRYPLGKDNMGGTAANRVTATQASNIGQGSGAETHTLSLNEIPSHAHDPINRDVRTAPFTGSTATNVLAADLGGGQYTINTSNAGGGAAHNNMPPYQTVNYIVKT